MKLDPGMHIGLHLVLFGKTGVTAVLRAEALEDQLLKSRKHAAAMQSKLDAAFAKYHNDVQEL
jgi:hypothetical protein